MTTISFRQTLSLVAIFVAVSATLIVMDRRDALDPLREGLISVVEPVASGFASIARGPNFESDLERELERVEAERDAALAENANLKAMIAEYEVLDQERVVESQRPELDFLAAKVIGGDPTGTQHFAWINKGSDDGVEVGMAVTDPDFYVGQVVEVTESTAKVMFIVDTSASVGAQLLESGADGIVVGQWQLGGRLLLQNIDRSAEVEEGAVVVTSGALTTETRGVPPNIIIGTVFGEGEPTLRTNEVSYQVRPVVEFESLNTVWVVMPNDE
ncbi:MAG TPA: rod shape-determining protein MreC [Thermomicrobiales bacterium]|nr:rod shape-determining protein MreC [Thermomicrobiales bacterium]